LMPRHGDHEFQDQGRDVGLEDFREGHGGELDE
jgi:hypothetical protein